MSANASPGLGSTPMNAPSSSSLSHSARSPAQAQSPNQGSTQVASKPKLIPTNSVSLKDGTTVRVRIEATLAVEDVVRQLCISVKIKDPPNMYALRDENDELVTNENLKKKIAAKVNLK